MYLRTALILAVTLLCSVISISQEKSALTQGQRVVLDTPDVISLELIPLITRRGRGGSGPEKLSGPFKPRSKIGFAILAANTSITPLEVLSWDTYSQNRPRLFRDGQEVPYREGIMDLLKGKDKEAASELGHLFVIRLKPNEPKVLENIDLSLWYESLDLGHYDLSVQHRFVQGGKLVGSSSIVFEVEKAR